LVQPQVAKITRVCAYDRAGFGWSDLSPKPRTAQNIVEELHILLVKSGITGPYILVGHSMGGMLVRLYAHQYPDEVAGMVLVDSVHEEQSLRFPDTVQKALAQLENKTQQQLGLFKILSATGIIALDPSRVPVQSKLPKSTAETHQALLASNDGYFDALSAEIAADEESSAQMRAAHITSLGEIPLIVISHGQPGLLPASLNLPPEAVQQFETVWRELQIELANLSPNGKLVIAEQSSHYIQLDQPNLVIDAIQLVLETTRK